MDKQLLLKPLYLLPTHLVCPLLLLGPKQAELMPSRQKEHLILAFPFLQASLALPQPQGPAHEFLQKFAQQPRHSTVELLKTNTLNFCVDCHLQIKT